MFRRIITVAAVSSLLVLACGDATDSEFGDGSGAGGLGGAGGGDGTGFGGGATSGGIKPGGPVSAACATSSASGKNEPVYLVFIVDRSGSMKFNPQPNNKWDSVLAGLTSFFKDPQSAGLFASEQVFPQSSQCAVASYQTPLVGVTALPDSAGTLAAALAANGPNPNFGTPTEPALEGGVAFAKSLEATGKKTAVVLVTDGEPNGCNSNVSGSAAAAGAGLPNIKTYVIGVGDLLTNLDAIASGGGTNKAVIVSTTNPSSITGDFVNALGGIRKEALSCDYALPAPPSGETLDVNKVNVQFTPSGGSVETLEYSADCAAGAGWRYDALPSPSKIIICPQSCNTLLANADGKIDIVFGCSTAGTVPR